MSNRQSSRRLDGTARAAPPAKTGAPGTVEEPPADAASRGAGAPSSDDDAEARFQQVVGEQTARVAAIEEADIVIGIPFHNETGVIASVLETIDRGLEDYYPNLRCVVIAAGAPAAAETLKLIESLPPSRQAERIAFLLDDERIGGKGWSLRAIMEITRSLGADLAIVEADVRSRARGGTVDGLAPDWVSLLLDPLLTKDMDLVVSRFNRHYLDCPIASHLVYPLLTTIYNRPVHDPVGAQWGISHRLLGTYLRGSRYPWHADLGGYGIDAWLATTAIASEARLCEVNLGIKVHTSSPGKSEVVLQQVARVLFEQIVADREWWGAQERVGKSSLLRPLPTFAAKKEQLPDEVTMAPQRLMEKYRQGFDTFHTLYRGVFAEDTYRCLEQLARVEASQFRLPARLWAQILYYFLLDFSFGKDFTKGDLLMSLQPLVEARTAGFALDLQDLKDRLQSALPDQAERLVALEAQQRIDDLVDELLRLKPGFLASWEMSREALKPPVPKVTYREFIPDVPLVVPLELVARNGAVVTANAAYERLFHRYQTEFDDFIHERLAAPAAATSSEIVGRVEKFMHRLEAAVDAQLLPGDLFTVEGARSVVETIFPLFRRQATFALVPEMASWILWRYPPANLLTKMGYHDLNGLLREHDPRDMLALSGWSEEREHAEQVWSLIKSGIRSEHFEECPLKPLVVNYEDYPSLVEMKDVSTLNRVSGRVVASNLHKGMGGEFPKLRYLTTVARSIIEAERFSDLWRGFAQERKDFGEKVINSLEGHWGSEPLSAHNIFENGNQRVLVDRIRELADALAGDTTLHDLARHLGDMAGSYHLAATLADGTFLPCSAWTWASYSFRGGSGLPTPLSLHVERDWSSDEFLAEYFQDAGGSRQAIDREVTILMAQGRESEDLAPILLGDVSEAGSVIVRAPMAPKQAPATGMTRFAGNPILASITEHPWESKYVLNPGTIKLDGKFYLVYRAVGVDDTSRLGLAVSSDGFDFPERLDQPVFEPEGRSEEHGCEDPRLTQIGDRIYMLYTAYSGLIAQIAMASIGTSDFINYNWKAWHRHGLVFPGFFDKDAILFPERFGGRFAMLHRVDPHIWITFSPHLRCPWPRREHKILAGSRPGMVWDGAKIGAGAPPLKTRFGWLLITHGVDHSHVYRLGVMLLHLTDPTIVLYRSPNCVLEPVESYEVGEPVRSWVPNVVFTCGALPLDGTKPILEGNDELLIYYGAADTAVAVARGRIADLISEKFA
ncbi:MAG: hypothetical protein V3S10_03465 [Dehalococcoidales bacterium]